jgi:hypothetical protein
MSEVDDSVPMWELQKFMTYDELVEFGRNYFGLEPKKIQETCVTYLESKGESGFSADVEKLFYPRKNFMTHDDEVEFPKPHADGEDTGKFWAYLHSVEGDQGELFAGLNTASSGHINEGIRNTVIIPNRLYWLMRVIAACAREHETISGRHVEHKFQPLLKAIRPTFTVQDIANAVWDDPRAEAAMERAMRAAMSRKV